jgi:tRNA(Ile)-lysidine synthase
VADDWERQGEHLCNRWRRRGWPVRWRCQRLTGSPDQGESIEAWARAGRYAALTDMAREEGASLVLLGQHRRDQAETVLLQALRGGGSAGLSAMPPLATRNGLTWARPWLKQRREAIEAYIIRHRLHPVEDPSNQDVSLARNRLRLAVWPALQQAFEGVEPGLVRVAERAQQEAAVLAEVAAECLQTMVNSAGQLQVAAWRSVSLARQAVVLRAWWRQVTGRGAPDTLVERLLQEVSHHGVARWPADAGWACVLYRGALSIVAVPGRTEASRPAVAVFDLSKPGRWPVHEWRGYFEVDRVSTQGVPAVRLRAVRLAPRQGGERFQLAPASLPRSLKKQFQAEGVPEHLRQGPLVWCADQLIWVPGLGLDARCWAEPGQPGLALRWHPDPGASGQTKPPG